MQPTERRYLASAIIRTARFADHKKVLSGVAARFGSLSEDLGGFRERLAPGCFRDSLASGRDIAMLVDHDSGKPIGRLSNRTLSLQETSDGLAFRCEIDDRISHARDIFLMASRGDITECSFGFVCRREDWGDEPDPQDRNRRIPIRTVRQADLHEISAVTFPAYAGGATSVTASVVDSQTLTAGAGRSLWPAGAIPAEIRSHVPGIAILDPQDEELLHRARRLLSRAARD